MIILTSPQIFYLDLFKLPFLKTNPLSRQNAIRHAIFHTVALYLKQVENTKKYIDFLHWQYLAENHPFKSNVAPRGKCHPGGHSFCLNLGRFWTERIDGIRNISACRVRSSLTKINCDKSTDGKRIETLVSLVGGGREKRISTVRAVFLFFFKAVSIKNLE